MLGVGSHRRRDYPRRYQQYANFRCVFGDKIEPGAFLEFGSKKLDCFRIRTPAGDQSRLSAGGYDQSLHNPPGDFRW